MTMHLLQGVTTTRTKQRKRKITKADMANYEERCRQHNKRMKSQGRHDERMTLDEYIDYCHGVIKSKPSEFKSYTPNYTVRRETKHIPSLDTGVGVCPAPVKKEYTGTLIKGIATMHKSNAVPVLNQEEATDIANMRRN
jgi:hypothetical protein